MLFFLALTVKLTEGIRGLEDNESYPHVVEYLFSVKLLHSS